MKSIIDPSSKTIIQIPDKVAPALCLDLDGTIRHNKSGKTLINGADEIVLYPGVEAKIWEYRNRGFLVFGVSNQGGAAHGFKTVADNELEVQATIALFQQNPFHIIKCSFSMEDGKVEPYNHRSLLRKPQIGMLALCEVESWNQGYIVDWDNSLMVGDRPEDEELARNAKIKFDWAWSFFGREKPVN